MASTDRGIIYPSSTDLHPSALWWRSLATSTDSALSQAESTLRGEIADVAASVSRTPSASTAIHRTDEGTYRLYRHLGGDLWWQLNLRTVAYAGGDPILQIQGSQLGRTQTAEGFWGNPSITYPPGTAWSTFENQASYQGRHMWSVTPGHGLTWRTPPGVDSIGWRSPLASNGGYAVVTLSGGQVANQLPTAQQEVSAGRLAASALTSNGGRLSPSDRLLSTYKAGTVNYDATTPIAVGLPRAQYEVTVTVTGYADAASAAARVWTSGLAYTNGIAGTPADGIAHIDDPSAAAFVSAWEYAIYTTLNGRTEWAGNYHGYEVNQTLQFTVGGTPVSTIPVGGFLSGDDVTVTRTTRLVHPEQMSFAWAEVITVYRMTADGLDLSWRMRFIRDTTVTRAYAAMLPLPESYDRAVVGNAAPTLTLTRNDGTSHGINRETDVASVWRLDDPEDEQGPGIAYTMRIPDTDTTVDAWQWSSGDMGKLWIEDRATGHLNKIYLTRVTSDQPQVVQPGTVWRSRVLIDCQYMASPDTVLGR